MARAAHHAGRSPAGAAGGRLPDQFELDVDLFRSAVEGIATPAGWTMRRADTADFALPGMVVPAAFWRDADQFLEHGGGWRAEKDGTCGALAFTSFRFGDELELGIETAHERRGQGLAAAVAARMIGDLLDEGLTPVWACREGNAASLRLAEKLGFRFVRQVPYYGLATPAGPGATTTAPRTPCASSASR